MLQGVLKHTHIIQNVNTQSRITVWTVHIKTKVHVTPAKWNTVTKLHEKIRSVLAIWFETINKYQ